jgi:hypothetical protein
MGVILLLWALTNDGRGGDGSPIGLAVATEDALGETTGFNFARNSASEVFSGRGHDGIALPSIVSENEGLPRIVGWPLLTVLDWPYGRKLEIDAALARTPTPRTPRLVPTISFFFRGLPLYSIDRDIEVDGSLPKGDAEGLSGVMSGVAGVASRSKLLMS